jgi:hypothetical protein
VHLVTIPARCHESATNLELVLELSRFGSGLGFPVRSEFSFGFPSAEVLDLEVLAGEASRPWMVPLSWFSPRPSTKAAFEDCWNLRALIRLSLSPCVRTRLDRLEFFAFPAVWGVGL